MGFMGESMGFMGCTKKCHYAVGVLNFVLFSDGFSMSLCGGCAEFSLFFQWFCASASQAFCMNCVEICGFVQSCFESVGAQACV